MWGEDRVMLDDEYGFTDDSWDRWGGMCFQSVWSETDKYENYIEYKRINEEDRLEESSDPRFSARLIYGPWVVMSEEVYKSAEHLSPSADVLNVITVRSTPRHCLQMNCRRRSAEFQTALRI